MGQPQNFAVDYDSENDSLFLYNPKSKSKGAIEFGDIILDFNNKKELVAIEILNASRWLADTLDEDESQAKATLEQLKKTGRISSSRVGSWLKIRFILFWNEKEITDVLSVPAVHTTSPALVHR